MSFECAVFADGYRCPRTEAGGSVYLGGLTFCTEHQGPFEDLVQGGVLSREIAGAKLDRYLGPIFKNTEPVAAPSKKDLRRKATVYFFRCGAFVKIGVSTVPRLRIQQIRAGTVLFPEGMDIAATQIVGTEPGGYPRESELHAKFSHLRHVGEWFNETPELTEYIESLIERSAA